ncbi:unnamed protein product [Penicillium salamii]|nr:unnamed protein product [Penicillium salamii]CAG8316240.1 unnamed protein product [Penicillium salamii]CAG8408581.1 unnamed protein product [Penicillium salamii]
MTTAATMSIAETSTVSRPFPLKHFASYSPRKSLPAVWMRSGTSKGLFIHRSDLPDATEDWAPILLSAMGSSGSRGKQIDGIGGATSTTSKVAVIAKSTRPGIDVDYTFVQVAPDQAKIDMTGNCGNIASGVGPFSVDEGLVVAMPGQKEASGSRIFVGYLLTDHQISVRVYNTNTQKAILETIQLSPVGKFREDGTCRIPGVEGTSSPIKVAFLNPAGSMTGKMFPSGVKQEILTLQSPNLGAVHVRVSLVDAGNPFVLVDSGSLNVEGKSMCPFSLDTDLGVLAEEIRRNGAVQLGLASDVESAGLVRGTPKIAFLSAPAEETSDIDVLAFSMGKPHPSIQMTGAVCIGAAMAIYGTVAWHLSRASDSQVPKHGMNVGGQRIANPVPVRIRHPAGVIETETVLDMRGEGDVDVEQVAVMRTARRLFEGNVFYRA